MKLDLHVHIKHYHRLADLRRVMRERGLGGIAITNFWNISYAQWLRERLPEFLIIVGKEVVTRRGHILAIGIEENLPDFLEPAETIDRIHAQNGLAILPHPFLIYNSIAPLGRAAALPFDAIEVFNYRAAPFLWPNTVAGLLLRKSGKPLVADTDAKDIVSIGRCCIAVPGETQAELLANIRAGRFVRHIETAWPTPRWAFDLVHSLATQHKTTNCPLCGKIYVRTLWKKNLQCAGCGIIFRRRIHCPEKHYLCKACRTTRDFAPEALIAYRQKLGIEV